MVGRVLLGAAVLGAIAGPVQAERGPEPVPSDATPRRLFTLGYGMGGVSRLGDAAPGRDMGAFIYLFGQRLRSGLHLVEQLTLIPSIPVLRDPPSSDAHMAFLVGVRWSPFTRNRTRQSAQSPFPGKYFEVRALYVGASVGAGFRERVSTGMDEVTWAPVAAAHVGYTPIQGEDWAFGVEWREQLERYSEGYQRGWSLLVMVEIH